MMNAHSAREGIHRDWLPAAHRPIDTTAWRLVPRVEAGSRTLTDTAPVEQAPTDTRPYSDEAARATPWVLPPEPRDADEASQQISDYFDAVADMVRRLDERHTGK